MRCEVVLKKRIYYVILLIAVFAMQAYHVIAEKGYAAGLYVQEDAKPYLNILNPGDEIASVEVSLYYEKNDSGKFTVNAAPHSTTSVDLSARAGKGSFGISIDSDDGVVADAIQHDATYSAGFGSLLAAKTDFVWYFAEGYSSGMVKTYLSVLNPNPKTTELGITLYYNNGEKRTFNVQLPAYRHTRIDLKEKTMPEKRFGIKATSTMPVVASIAHYDKKFSGGSGGTGASALSRNWYFPDGYTSTEATEFLNLVNPSLGVAHVNFTFYYDDGTSVLVDETVPANSKSMFMLNNYVEGSKWYSTAVASDINIMADITHYDSEYSAGHGGAGAASGAYSHHFAHAKADDSTRSHVAIFNPSTNEADLEATFYYADGKVKTLSFKAPSMMRSTFDLNTKAIQGMPFGLSIKGTEKTVAEIVSYDTKNSDGYSYVGLQKDEETTPAADEEITSPIVPVTTDKETGELTLAITEDVSPLRFKSIVRDGLNTVTKNSYSDGVNNAIAWHFEYSDAEKASAALLNALSGGMFSILEVEPSRAAGADAHSFISEKSEGYIWLNDTSLYFFIAGKGKIDVAEELLKTAAANAGEGSRNIGIGTILLILLSLILLIVILRTIFRGNAKKEADDEETAVWKDVIPSARPKGKKKAAAKHSAKPAAKETRKEGMHAPASHPEKEQKSKEDRRAAAHSEERKEEQKAEAKHEKKPEQKPAPRQQQKPKEEPKQREEKRGVPNISIKEVPRDKLTAQDLLDQMEEIPDYEDVFRHVNRDQEEIKPR